MSLKRAKGREARKSIKGATHKETARRTVTKLTGKTTPKVGLKAAPKIAAKTAPKLRVQPAPKIAVKTALKSAVKAVAKGTPKVVGKGISRQEIKAASKLALREAAAVKPTLKLERIHSHPTMCLHCHLIVEMFHERGADPVKGAWQCPRCGHKYLFSHWKIKRQARGKPEAA